MKYMNLLPVQKRARKPRSYASLKLWPTWLVKWWLTGVKCRATSVARNLFFFMWSLKLYYRSQRRWQRSRLRPFLPSLTITEMGRWARRSSSSLWNQKRVKKDPKHQNIFSFYHYYLFFLYKTNSVWNTIDNQWQSSAYYAFKTIALMIILIIVDSVIEYKWNKYLLF